MPLPHHTAQSLGHDQVVSPSQLSHLPLPQVGVGQSIGQLDDVSPGSQIRLPHLLGVGQSQGQLWYDSQGDSHMPLPQMFVGQSQGQLYESSFHSQ
jgi:hypothetical protein